MIFNHRLEHLGDSVLSLVVTSLLREVYPYLRVGSSTVSPRLSDGTNHIKSENLLMRSSLENPRALGRKQHPCFPVSTLCSRTLRHSIERETDP